MSRGADLLRVEELQVAYGESRALFGIDFTVPQGTVIGLVGRNGAGKTTTLRAVAGLQTVSAGRVIYKGQDITNKRPDLISRRGVATVPEYRGVFSLLTVRENLDMVARSNREWTIDRVRSVFPILERLMNRKGGNLSGGEQQIVAIARALLTNPTLLLLDEPSQGLAPVIVKEIFRSLNHLKESGVGMLLVEQRLDLTLEISDTIYVLDRGNIVYCGQKDEVVKTPGKVSRHLGVG